MAYNLNVYRMLTNRYISQFRHLDESEFVLTQKIPNGRMVDEGNGYDCGPTYVYTLRAPVNAPKDYARLLSNEMSYSGCSHDYDCCGCSSQYASVTKLGPRKYQVKVRTSYNY